MAAGAQGSVGQQQTQPGGTTGGPERARRSNLRDLDRAIGRLSLPGAVAVLTGIAVVSSLALCGAVWSLFYGAVPEGMVVVIGLVCSVVAGPIILHAQRLIRSLDRSKRDLRDLADQLAVARDEAQAANRAKSEFLANMSHELRTPLNAIIGFAEIMKYQLRGPAGDSAYAEYASDIHASGKHLLSVINDILDLARIEAGSMQIEEEAVDLRRAILAASRIVSVDAEARGVSVRAELGVDLPVFVGDARLLRQILLNLLSNAIKFSPRGGRVDVSARRSDKGELLLSVADRGIGMSEKDLAVALTPFGQVENVLSRRNGGTGLGLPLSKAMTELHGGSFELSSAPGRGTTIVLRFPPERMRDLAA